MNSRMWAMEQKNIKKWKFAMLNREKRRDIDGEKEWRWMERH